MLVALATICATASFSGCTTFFGEPPKPEIVSVCPSIVEYPRDVQERALLEWGNLEQSDTAPVIRGMMEDYNVLRNKIRACNSVKKDAAKKK